jgi:CheY-like chemotaxis protein
MKKGWPILVVDDEEVMCESMAAWLREDGYRVDTASNGQAALELGKTTDYAISFIDLKMPGGMDGIETMMEMRRIRPEASIIIITAYATVDTAIQADMRFQRLTSDRGRKVAGFPNADVGIPDETSRRACLLFLYRGVYELVARYPDWGE